MKAENMNVNVPEGKDKVEVIIRELTDEVKDKLPIQEPKQVTISGQITAVFAFLEKRWNAADDQIDHSRTHILVDRDNVKMTLVVNETDARNTKLVTGKAELSRQYKSFGVNTDTEWDPYDLGQFFRINRTYFASSTENMDLVNLLKSFKATIQSDVEREIKDNGSITDVYKKVVDSNLPESFEVKIPIFKGTDPETIKIDVIARVVERQPRLSLISADAAAIVEDVRDKLIDDQLDKIKELAPEIPIIEV